MIEFRAGLLVTAFFTATTNAVDVYHVLDEGNSDLSNPRLSAADFTGVQPVGDRVSRYHGLAEGNPDLFNADRTGPSRAGSDSDI